MYAAAVVANRASPADLFSFSFLHKQSLRIIRHHAAALVDNTTLTATEIHPYGALEYMPQFHKIPEQGYGRECVFKRGPHKGVFFAFGVSGALARVSEKTVTHYIHPPLTRQPKNHACIVHKDQNNCTSARANVLILMFNRFSCTHTAILLD